MQTPVQSILSQGKCITADNARQLNKATYQQDFHLDLLHLGHDRYTVLVQRHAGRI